MFCTIAYVMIFLIITVPLNNCTDRYGIKFQCSCLNNYRSKILQVRSVTIRVGLNSHDSAKYGIEHVFIWLRMNVGKWGAA